MKRRHFIGLLAAVPAGVGAATAIPATGITPASVWSVGYMWCGGREKFLRFTCEDVAVMAFNEFASLKGIPAWEVEQVVLYKDGVMVEGEWQRGCNELGVKGFKKKVVDRFRGRG